MRAGLAQELIPQISPDIISAYFGVSTAVLLFYDYLLTFSLELSEMWWRRFNLSKGLFIINRYASLLYASSYIFLYFHEPVTDIGCRASSYVNQFSSLFTATAIMGIFTLRTFAIYEKSYIVLSILAIPALGIVATNIWTIVGETASANQLLQSAPFTCDFTFSSTESLSAFINFLSVVFFDALVLSLTIYRTARLAKRAKESGIKGALSFVLFRDGVLYYAAVFLPTFGTLALDAISLKSIDVNIFYASDDMSFVNNVLQIIVVNRMILNLSYSANTREEDEFRSRTGLEPPAFALNSIIGNIGAPVNTIPNGALEDTIETLEESHHSKLIKRNGDLETQCSDYTDSSIHRFSVHQ